MVQFDAGEPGGGTTLSHWAVLPALTLGLGLTFWVARFVLVWFATPVASAYQESVITLALIAGRLTHVTGVLVFLLGLILLFVTRAYRLRWSDLDAGRNMRLLAIVMGTVLAWKFSTYGPNLYFGEWHLFDRVLLVALVPLLWWRPVAVVPFLIVLLGIQAQFRAVMPVYGWALESLLVQILILVAVVTVVLPVVRRFTSLVRPSQQAVWIVLFSIFAANYWASGFDKLITGWFVFDPVHFLLPAGYANGWLNWLDADTVASIASGAGRFDVATRLLTGLFECGAVLFLSSRRLAIWLTVGWILFHLGIMAACGIFFWTWILADAALILVLVRRGGVFASALFNRRAFAVSVILIISSGYWLDPTVLRWYDSPVTYKFTFEGIGPSGNTYELTPDFFSPNDYPFRLSGFSYLVASPHSMLPVSFGATTNRDLAKRLRDVSSIQEAVAVESELGQVRYDADRADRLISFLSITGMRSNRLSPESAFPDWLRAPPSIWVPARGEVYDRQEPIAKINVTMTAWVFAGGQIEEVRSTPVASVTIGDGERESTR